MGSNIDKNRKQNKRLIDLPLQEAEEHLKKTGSQISYQMLKYQRTIFRKLK